ncbi:hypothetical protein ACWDWT_21515 [Streptomyces sp. NPDC003343]
MPTFNDPVEQAIYRLLIGAGEPPATDAQPTPAAMPKRATRPRDAADIARAEGLDLGDLRTRRVVRRPGRRRPARPSAFKEVFDYLADAGCSRPEAYQLTRAWLDAGCVSLEEVHGWVRLVGKRQAHLVRELLLHGLAGEDLNLLIDGTPALRRLRNGEPVGQVVGALLALRNTP